jgi:hypothetical protein
MSSSSFATAENLGNTLPCEAQNWQNTETKRGHDSSAGGLVLKTGAVAAVLSLVVGVVVGRLTGLQLAKLSEQKPSTAGPAPEVQQQLSALRKRAIWSSRLTAGLLGIAVLSMAVFRYAQTMA